MKILVNSQIYLSEFRPSDKSALIENLNDRDIYDRTFRIPFPYTDADAEAFSLVSPRPPSSMANPLILPFAQTTTP